MKLWWNKDKLAHAEKHLKETIPFDPEHQIPIIKSSICTGEMVAGFRDKDTGHFIEVMVLHSEVEKRRFLMLYDLEQVKTEY